MRIYKTCCDRCKREIKEEEKPKGAYIRVNQIARSGEKDAPMASFFDSKWQEYNSVELCPDCWYDLNTFIFGKK